MGVEMTLLRALAFHPRMPLPEPEVPRQSFAPVAPTAVMTPTQVPPQPQSAPQQAPTVPLPETTSQVLAARQQLQRVQGATKAKKSEPAAATRARPVNNAALERLAWSPIAFRRVRCHRRWKKRQLKKKRIAGRRPLR